VDLSASRPFCPRVPPPLTNVSVDWRRFFDTLPPSGSPRIVRTQIQPIPRCPIEISPFFEDHRLPQFCTLPTTRRFERAGERPLSPLPARSGKALALPSFSSKKELILSPQESFPAKATPVYDPFSFLRVFPTEELTLKDKVDFSSGSPKSTMTRMLPFNATLP